MPDQPNKSDDLIAELAKLMANNAQVSEAPASSPAGAAPLAQAPGTSPPIRIPGVAAPAMAGAPAMGAVRIPGLNQSGSVPAAPAARLDHPAPGDEISRASAQPDAAFAFDFGISAAPSAETPRPEAATPRDPIADLIAAEIAETPRSTAPVVEESAGHEARDMQPVPAAPSVRSFGAPQAGAMPKPMLMPLQAGGSPRAAPSGFVPVKPISVPGRPASESDRFAISPVPGAGAKTPPPPAPVVIPVVAAPPPIVASAPLAATEAGQATSAPVSSGFSDPMSEIENLIGEAVHVELTAPEKPAAAVQSWPQEPLAVSPVVPPLTTQFAPRRTALRDNEPGLQSAEEAILAAAAATGAEVGRIDGGMAEERAYKRLKIKSARTGMMPGGMRQYVGMAVAGTLLLAAGFGLYWVLGMGRIGGDAEAPMLTADPSPVKEAPAAAPEATDAARSPVFDQIEGVTANDGGEQLVSTDQAGGDVARVIAPENTADTETGLANRKVRTVTVRPDGTIVSGDAAVAGAEALPVDRPDVPVVPGTVDVEPTLLPAEGLATTDAIAAAIVDDAAPPTADALVAEVPADAPVINTALVAPIPMPRPLDRAALALSAPAVPDTAVVEGGALTPTGQIDLMAPAAPAAAVDVPAAIVQPAGDGSTAAAYVQLYSEGSQAEAENKVRSGEARWGNLFNGARLTIQRADLGQKGIRYRVRLPAASLQEATQICAAIKANGGDCFATKG